MAGPTPHRSSPWTFETEAGDFRWRRSESGVVAEWVGLLTLRIDAAGRVTGEPVPGADARLVDKLMHTGAAAFVRALREQPSLHASAVARAGTALVCIGEKGSGKSTAAWEMCRAHGLELLADDVTALQRADAGWTVLPTESSHWVSTEDPAGKGPVRAPSVARGPADLRALVLLRFDDAASPPAARRLRGAEAYAALSSALLRFEPADALRVRELDVLSSIAAQAGVHELVRARACSVAETAGHLLPLLGDSR